MYLQKTQKPFAQSLTLNSSNVIFINIYQFRTIKKGKLYSLPNDVKQAQNKPSNTSSSTNLQGRI